MPKNQIPRTIRFYPHELQALEREWKRDQARALVAGAKVPNWNRWVTMRLMENRMKSAFIASTRASDNI